MASQAREIIDAARGMGVVLRMIGGLAVRQHCRDLWFCERDYSDIDLVGRSSDYKGIATLLGELGYVEAHEVRFATRGRQLQFVRSCAPSASDGARCIKQDDHVDVFLDTFRMDHDIRLVDRLEIEPYTVSLTDILLTKLQITRLTDKDVRDIVTVLKDVPVGADDAPGTISVGRIAALTAEDWGLYRDVSAALDRAAATPHLDELDTADRERVAAAVARLRTAIEEAPKTRAWRRRARVGERRPWSNPVEDQDDIGQGVPLRGGS